VNTMIQCISYLQTARKPIIQLVERSTVIFSVSLVSYDLRKANKNVL